MKNASAIPLSPEQIEDLDTYLMSDKVHEDTMDFVTMHGFLCAMTLDPKKVDEATWLANVFALDDAAAQANIDDTKIELIQQEYRFIQASLEANTLLELPCELSLEVDDDDYCLLQDWALGFSEWVINKGDVWFDKDAEQMAQMLLPFFLAADVIPEEEIPDKFTQPAVQQELIDQIPDLLQDIYLDLRIAGK